MAATIWESSVSDDLLVPALDGDGVLLVASLSVSESGKVEIIAALPWVGDATSYEYDQYLQSYFLLASTVMVDDETTGINYDFDKVSGEGQIEFGYDDPSATSAYVDLTFQATSETPAFIGIIEGQAPCFASGTLISTPIGPVLVEALGAGDVICTLSGKNREIVWAGCRHVDISRHPNPELARPIRILAGAFGSGQPSSDLVVSPDHSLFVDGVLIPAKCLMNGKNVAEIDLPAVTYHHIELATHDIVFANDMPAETYLDTGNRANFNGEEETVEHPDFSSSPDLNYFKWISDGCAPLVMVGLEVDVVRNRLLARYETSVESV